MQMPLIFVKAHVNQFTRSDGAVVQAHETNVPSAAPRAAFKGPRTMVRPGELHSDAARMPVHAFLDKHVAEMLPGHMKHGLEPAHVIHDQLDPHSVSASEYEDWADVHKETTDRGRETIQRHVDNLKRGPGANVLVPPVLIHGHKDEAQMPQVADGHHRTAAHVIAGSNKMNVIYDSHTLAKLWKNANKSDLPVKQILEHYESHHLPSRATATLAKSLASGPAMQNNKPVLFIKAHVDAFTRKDGATVAAHETKVQAAPAQEGPDEHQPKYALQGIPSEHLSRAAKGKDDLNKRAKVELANRGMDSDHKWIGFDKAAEHHGVTVPKGDPDAIGGHFQTIHPKVLSAAAKGEVDLNANARQELANRGHDSDGKWVGFDQAAAHHAEAAKAKPAAAAAKKPAARKAKPALDPHPNVIGKATDGDKHAFKFGGKQYTHTGKEGNSMHDQTPVKEAESDDGHRVWRDDTDRVHADSQEEAKKARSGK